MTTALLVPPGPLPGPFSVPGTPFNLTIRRSDTVAPNTLAKPLFDGPAERSDM